MTTPGLYDFEPPAPGRGDGEPRATPPAGTPSAGTPPAGTPSAGTPGAIIPPAPEQPILAPGPRPGTPEPVAADAEAALARPAPARPWSPFTTILAPATATAAAAPALPADRRHPAPERATRPLPEGDPVISVETLGVAFSGPTGTVTAVRDLSLTIHAGRTVALVGESGSGKSVTAQAIMGLLPRNATITQGRIVFTDPDTGQATLLTDGAPRALRALRGRHFGMIFQEPMSALSPVHTVASQLTEGVVRHRLMDAAAARTRALDLLAEVGFPVPERIFRAYPFELSGGQRQRVVIAMALMANPALLIADEPTTALDVTVQAQVLALIQRVAAARGAAVLLITHDLGVVSHMADTIAVAYRGRIMESGPARTLLKAPEHPYLRGLLGAVPRLEAAPGERLQPIRPVRTRMPDALAARSRPAGGLVAALPRRRVRVLGDDDDLGGRGLPAFDPAAGGAVERVRGLEGARALEGLGEPPPVMQIDHVIKSFRGRRGTTPVLALDDVTLTLRRGECLGLVGESGSGKTTLIKILTGALAADAGQVLFTLPDGEQVDITRCDRRAVRALSRHRQMIFQDPFSSLNPRQTVEDILTEPMAVHRLGRARSRRERAAELLEVVGLKPAMLGRYPHSFSGGQRQRIAIARALALEPSVILCDEPVSALDVSIQAQVLNLLLDLRQAMNLTYLFVSHNLGVVRYIADRVAVLCRGRLVEVAPVETLFADPRHPYTRALLAAVPDPDPDRPLDLERILAGDAADADLWPQPYAGRALPLRAVGDGHFVAMAA